MAKNIYDPEKDTSKQYDTAFLKKIAIVYPAFVLDSLSKAPNDVDADIEVKKALATEFANEV